MNQSESHVFFFLSFRVVVGLDGLLHKVVHVASSSIIYQGSLKIHYGIGQNDRLHGLFSEGGH
jgi:hypothetical protein